MSITNEKLQTIKDNVSKVYRSGQMNVIKNANSLKGFESNKAMLLDDVSPVEHEMNVKVRGKNLVDDTKRLFTGGNIFFGFTQSSGIIPIKLSKGIYTFSVVTTDGTTTNLYIKNSDNTKILFTAYSGNKLTFTLSETQDILLNIYKSEYTSTDDVVTAQLELGTTATDYEPYNNDIQNVHSKNLIPYPYRDLKLGTSTYNGVDFTVYEDGSILINGTAASNTTRYLYNNKTDLLGLKSGITISCSKNASDDTQQGNIYLVCNYYDSTGTMQPGAYASTTSSGKTTITDDWKGLGIYLHIPSGKTISNLLVKPQLELGSTATYYEKYHEPYPLVVSRYGKNLFDKSILFEDYTSFGNGYKWLSIYVGSGSTVTVSLLQKYDLGLGGYFYCVAYKSNSIPLDSNQKWLYHNSNTTLCVKSVTMISEDGYISLIMSAPAYNIFKDEIMVEICSNATEYEPYITPTEYTPTTDGVINGVKNLYPNTTLISNGDKVYIDCNYYKDIDKAYNKLSAAIALSGGE